MKISTRGRYGLRAMLELARCRGDSPVLMSTLAEREGLSRKYLHALLTALKSAGLVQSVRGAGGGFVLSRDPSEMRLSEILGALEGPVSLVDCVVDKRACSRASGCTARGVWQELSRAIDSMLDSMTLEDLIVRERRGSSKRSGRNSMRGPRKRGADSRRSRVASRGRRQKA